MPQYEDLSLGKIVAFLDQFPEMRKYMPDTAGEARKLPRGFVINVGSTVVGKPFLDWVKAKILERNAKAAREQNLLIAMDPQLAQAFNDSTHFSRKYACD